MIRTNRALVGTAVEAKRDETAQNWPLDELWTQGWEVICSFELLPGSPLHEDRWLLPRAWASSGARQSEGARTIDFRSCLPAAWNRRERRSEDAIRRLKRIACLLFVQTLRLDHQVRNPPQPSTWVKMMKRVCRVAQDALEMELSLSKSSTCPDGQAIFSCVTPAQMISLKERHDAFFRADRPRFNALFKHGYFDDWPAGDVGPPATKKEKVRWQPFSDEFVGLLGNAAVWMTEVLGPDLLEAVERLHKTTKLYARAHKRVRSPARDTCIANWLCKADTRQLQFPYNIRVAGTNGAKIASRMVSCWGDIGPMEIENLASVLQEAHAAVLNLATGPRNGELAAFPRECIRQAPGLTLLHGYTFKLAEVTEEREWPLPRIAVLAIRQQQRLAEILDPGGDKLFVRIRGFNSRITGQERYEIPAKRFTDAIYTLDGKSLTSQCSGNVHSHRYRKTVARLAALSLVGANQILFDILGHRDPEMTLNYILSDPELQEEMRQIAQEAALLMARDALSTADTNGGPAAIGTRELKARFGARSAEKEMGESSLNVVARILSQDGRVMLVKRNVLCTKGLNQAGPCNKRIGNPDIANCKVDCLHRLELAAAKQDHRLAIFRALDEIEQEEGMRRAWYQAQIIYHLVPFADLAKEMLSDARVQSALEGVRLDALADLSETEAAAALRLLEEAA